ncbi:MAG: hypothetical protein ACE5KU_03640, partial [Nitrososphaerales archaeon]
NGAYGAGTFNGERTRAMASAANTAAAVIARLRGKVPIPVGDVFPVCLNGSDKSFHTDLLYIINKFLVTTKKRVAMDATGAEYANSTFSF